MEELFNSYKAFTKLNKIIKDKNINKALDMIGHYTRHIISLDIEFYSYMSLNLKYFSNTEILDNQRIRMVPFPKEVAGIWFNKRKDSEEWSIKGYFHFNTIPPHLLGNLFKFSRMKMIHSKYSTVSKRTNNEIKEMENKIFNDDKYLIRYLNPNELKFKKVKQLVRGSHRLFLYNAGKYTGLLKQIYNLYIKDELVRKREISAPSLYKILANIMGYPNTLITKEDNDVRAIMNYLQLLYENNKRRYPRVEKRINHHDIKIYNGILREKFGSAALEDEFYGIKTLSTFKKKVNKFYESNLVKLIDTAHNPLTDSIWALVVAITMILRCN